MNDWEQDAYDGWADRRNPEYVEHLTGIVDDHLTREPC